MSSAYEKQMAWKKSSVNAASTGAEVNDEREMTFKPTIFTSQDTNSKYKVQSRTKELTIQSGGMHVERYEKARLAKAEAERKLYGMGKAKPVQTLRPGYAVKMSGSGSGSGTRGNTSPGGGGSTTGAATTTDDNEGVNEEEKGTSSSYQQQHLQQQRQEVEVTEANHNATSGSSSRSEPKGGSKQQQQHSNNSNHSRSKGTTPTEVEDPAAFSSTPEADMTLQDMEEHLSIVQVLERERREWHSERAKLTQCIHLQQVELASRSSAAQETAALIAKEFARVIESFEERLEKVEGRTEQELVSIKELLLKESIGTRSGSNSNSSSK
jgi:hypothetical protein